MREARPILLISGIVHLVVVAMFWTAIGMWPVCQPAIERLPACKSGWINDTDLKRATSPSVNEIPTQFVYENEAEWGYIIEIRDRFGRLMATIRHGQTVSFDCFDIPVKETI
jgi:hypothetical protein